MDEDLILDDGYTICEQAYDMMRSYLDREPTEEEVEEGIECLRDKYGLD